MNTHIINPVGTAYEGTEFECFCIYHFYYAPKEHKVFYPQTEGKYSWDNAVFPDWDRIFASLKRLQEERDRLEKANRP